MKISYLAGMNVSASGLRAQRAVMDAAAENLANAHTTRTENGGPYRRKTVALAAEETSFAVRTAAEAAGGDLSRTDSAHLEGGARSVEREVPATLVQATAGEDPGEFPEVHDPGHPDADENGMVRMPNVDLAREMVTMMVASRAYEANIAALQASRRLAEASLNLAR